jgi:hypothetical protein
MKLATLAFLAFVAALAFLILFIADREKEAGVERISNYKIPHHAALDRNPDVNLVTTPRR